ncbi:polysaccharide deacetylase, partial [Leptolyngbya cf. ectocarpi LEGE 11479]|nr:polysaccharide deacetylase [Leptolyngbya cf. ectocarpi LEGE 11479]
PWELARRKKTNVLWNVDPKDYETPDPEKIADRVVNNVEPGSIVLLHDGGGDRSQTVAATKIVLQKLQQEGYQFKTISELMTLQV